jgi:RNA polymerase sigma factor (sigma-70 family)
MEELKPLVVRAQAGDLDAYGEIVGRFQDMAYGYAYSVLGDFHLAEDVAQEAFIEAYRCLANLREPAAFPGWFRRIVFKHCERMIRRKEVAAVPLEAAAGIASPGRYPAQAAEEREMKGKVLAAIRSLPEHERTVTTLFYINGYSQNDIAAFLEVAPGTVKSRLHNSRKRLKERILNMVSEQLKSHPLPDEFPKQIRELLSMPRPLEIKGHPVRELWEAFRSCFPHFEVVEFGEVLDRSASHLSADVMRRAAYEVDGERILRTGLTDKLIEEWLSRGGGPCKLITAGRAFRKGGTEAPWKSANVFHQAEILWVDEGLNDATSLEHAKRISAAVLPDAETRVSPSLCDVGAGVQAREMEAPWKDGCLEFAVAGLHSPETVKRGGLDPDRFGGICIALGLERCAQVRYGIDDIRKLWGPPYVPE